MISIIIVHYNTPELIEQCIYSIYEKCKIDFEVIVVDNASSIGDTDTIQIKFPRIKLIKSYQNLGFARGNNLGIAHAIGDYILLINSDAALKNDAISILKSFLDSHPLVAAVTGRLEYPSEELQHNCQRFPSISYQLIELLRLQKIFPVLKQNLFGSFFSYDKVAYPDWVWGTLFMFPRSLLDKLPNKKLAEDFFMYGEDMQWCMEFSMLGYKIGFCSDAHVIHHMGASGGKKNELIMKHESMFMRKYYPGWKRALIKFLNRLLTFHHAIS